MFRWGDLKKSRFFGLFHSVPSTLVYTTTVVIFEQTYSTFDGLSKEPMLKGEGGPRRADLSRQSTISLLLHKLLLCECCLCASETGPLCLLAQRTSLSRNTHLHTTDTYCTLSVLHYKHTKSTTPLLNNTSPPSLHFPKKKTLTS